MGIVFDSFLSQIPAAADTLFYVRGLKPDEKYMAAMAAYNEQGKLIGGSIGLTCRPVLAAHPLPTLMAWGYLAQVCDNKQLLDFLGFEESNNQLALTISVGRCEQHTIDSMV